MNASTFEVFPFPPIDEIFSHFWTPYGNEIGIVTKDWVLILINTRTGEVTRKPEEDMLTWYDFGYGGSQTVTKSPLDPGKLILFPRWIKIPGTLSFDG